MMASNLVIIQGFKATTRNLYGLYERNDKLNDMAIVTIYACMVVMLM